MPTHPPTPYERIALIAALLLMAGCTRVIVISAEDFKRANPQTLPGAVLDVHSGGCNTTTCDKNGVCLTTTLHCGKGSWSEK